MGLVNAEITLTNAADWSNAQSGIIRENEIKTATVQAIVDTGSLYLVITEELFQKLGLTVKGEKVSHTANGQRVVSKLTDGVYVHWNDRDTLVQALVIPGAEKILLGALALEGLDLMVNPVTQELVGIHGKRAEYALY
jgi:clan AA aspartic protease